jgi:phosphoesterase RecJ-like protein
MREDCLASGELLAEDFQLLQNTLRKISNPLLIIHPKPDADALGSVFSLSYYLKKIYAQHPTIFSIDNPTENLRFLFPKNQVVNSFEIERHDALIFLDRGDIFYKLKFDEQLKKATRKPLLINIDHHPHTSLPGALNIIDTTASATCEIIFRYFDTINFQYDGPIAQYLINGIYADTGGFRHNNTSARSLEISSRLMRKGASITHVNRCLFANKSINTLKLWGIALDRAKINPETGMVVSFITKNDLETCNATSDDISGISEILNTIADSKFSLVLSERETNKIKASLRSDEYKGIDVSKIARQFHGGGHKLASGFEIKGSLRQVGKSWIIE